jgi:serine/threonine protein kinase
MITLNLDSFMVRSFSDVHPGKELKSFVGRRAASLGRVLHSRHAFAFSMHGVMDDVSSWVFTVDELRPLIRSEAYKILMARLLTDYTILFVGITVDDLAVGGFLEQLNKLGIERDPHYWLTDRNDISLDDWAEKSGIRIIRYSAANGHEAMLHAVFDDLDSYQEPEVEAPPVVLSMSSSPGDQLPPPEVLVTYPLDKLRELLNYKAAELLGQHSEDNGWQAFEEFSDKYVEAIHRAWFTTDKPTSNKLFGYTLHEKIAQGAFGRVYRATDADGSDVAVKILLDDIREDMELRRSFRRGVEAMRILEASGVDGMVAYRHASEIPAFVTMEWINGPNLMQAKRDGLLNDWDSVLSVSLDLAGIIRRAHELPRAVLHRDIRPANVMLRDGYLGPSDWSVVVLDFDLSTYRGANEKSVLAAGSALGYLAPEQLEYRRTESTRNASVDSFGLGMTLLYLCSGKEPQAFIHLNADYEKQVRQAARSLGEAEWISIPERMSRLIIASTRDRQAERWDIPQMIRELKRLLHAWRDPESVSDADLIAEEISARSVAAYAWDEDREEATALATSLRTVVRGDTGTGKVVATVAWSSSGDENWAKLSKYLDKRIPQAIAVLSSGPWTVTRLPGGPHDFTLRAEASASMLRGRIDLAATSLRGGLDVFNFDAV